MPSRSFSLICLAMGILCLLAASYLAYGLVSERRAKEEDIQSRAAQEAATAAGKIDAELKKIPPLVDGLVEDLSVGRVTRAELARRLRDLAGRHPAIQGFGVAYETRSGKLDAPYVIRENGGFQSSKLESHYDYTAPEVAWFTDAVSGGKGWREPDYREPGGGLTVHYSAPFGSAGESGSGVVFVTIGLDGIADWLDALSVGASGWGVLMSKAGRLLVHPNRRMMNRIRDVRTSEEAHTDPELRELLDRALSGESGMAEYPNLVTGQSSWFFWAPVPETGWTVTVVRIQGELLREGRDFRRSIILITSLVLLAVCGFMVWGGNLLYRMCPKTAVLWGMVVIVSIPMIAGVMVIRRVTFNQSSDERGQEVRVLDADGLGSFLRSMEERWKTANRSLPTYVPTGVYVQSVKFVTSTETEISGYVWQKHPADTKIEDPAPFVFPDAINPTITLRYARQEDGREVTGWYFETLVRQDMDIRRYPFDHDSVSIRMLPREITGTVMLVPDLDAYIVKNPSALPGLAKNMDVAGWEVTGSFFDYEFREYNVDFGLAEMQGRETMPELRFNISVKRRLLDVMIQNGVPIVVILAMLFAVIATATRNPDESKMLGFNPAGVMRITSALFFVALIAHIQLRNTIAAQEVVFLEYTYFTVYAALLFTSLHSFLFSLDRWRLSWLQDEDSPAVKLLYWPAIFAIQYATTALLFY